MTDLQRGSVVTRGGDRGVVWTAWPDRLVILPIVEGPGPHYATDVPITELPDRFACEVKGDAVIQAGLPYSVTRRSQTAIGQLSDALIARVALAHIRAQREVVIIDKWRSERLHRRAGLDERTALR